MSMPLKKKKSSSPPPSLPPIASFPFQTKKRLETGIEGQKRERGPFTSRAVFQTVSYTYVVGHLKRHTFSLGSFLRTCRKKTCLLLLGVCPPPFEDGRRNERDLGIRVSKSRVSSLGSAITEKEDRLPPPLCIEPSSHEGWRMRNMDGSREKVCGSPGYRHPHAA